LITKVPQTLTSEEIRAQILEIFNKTRQSPNAEFDESHFLDFLIQPPGKKNNIKNSFKGIKKFNEFFMAVEMEFGICFSLSDEDKFYNIDQFVSKTKERIENTHGNKMIIERRIKEKGNYLAEIILSLVLLFILIIMKVHIISAGAIILYGIVIWWIIKNRSIDRKHNKELYKKITGNVVLKIRE
jgi:hypothetical protein